MKRRDVIALLGAAAAWPMAARAQQQTTAVIGYLDGASAEGRKAFVAAFRDGLKNAGFTESQNVSIEYRWADNQIERLPELAADLVRRNVNIITVAGNIAAQKVQAATSAVPVVFVVGNDAVKLGLVDSLSHPGHNITGVTPLNAELGPKRLEILHEAVPSARSVGVLINPANPLAASLLPDLERTAAALDVKLHPLSAGNDRELEDAFATFKRVEAGGLVIGADTFFNGRIDQLAALALRHKLPSVYQTRQFAAAGGLMSYGASISDAFRIAGVYAGRILKGEKPADLPVQQATRIELVVNLKAAKALDLRVAPALLARADEVIE